MNNKPDDLISIDFFIISYQKTNFVSVFKLLGFEIYQRVGNIFCIFGFSFVIK